MCITEWSGLRKNVEKVRKVYGISNFSRQSSKISENGSYLWVPGQGTFQLFLVVSNT